VSVTVTFKCGGCDAVAEGTRPLRAPFASISGRPHGFGNRFPETAEAVVPEGWVAHDPYTDCCYCPTCWDEIERQTEPKEAK
jgi:hypothetical protein